MKISLTLPLDATLSDVWDALHNPDVFHAVSAPFLKFEALEPESFPLRFQSKNRYLVKAKALGFIPMGTQEINPVDSSSGDSKIFTDNGKGVSGALSAVSRFTHRMKLEPSGKGPTLLTDELEFKAGILTPLLWVGFRLFWWWRHKRMKALVDHWHNHASALWDERYRNSQMWSGKVNPTLVNAVHGMTPGTALDVGAGEGADALWLAEQGFTVTALDASPVALARGETERVRRVQADSGNRAVRWIAADLVFDDVPASPKTYDLVVCHFLHLPQSEREAIWKKLVKAVSPGGTLVIVGHSLKDAKVGVRRPPEELLFSGSDVRRFIPASWKAVKVSEPRRSQTLTDGTTVDVTDVVVIATR